MSILLCPVCRAPLEAGEKRMVCQNGHSFDRAKQGYVNLLMSQKAKEKRHGDDKLMVRARMAFLDKGYYDLLKDGILSVLSEEMGERRVLLDAGCGECWYTEKIYAAFQKAGCRLDVTALDISKDALIIGAKRGCGFDRAVASVFDLPIKSGSCDIVLNLFAPVSPGEFHRVLKPGGVLVRAVPLERHLFGLKQAVYARPYENEVANETYPGLVLEETRDIHGRLSLTGREDIQNLFKMTPYYYKTSAEDQKKLERIDSLETEIAFRVLKYRKSGCVEEKL